MDLTGAAISILDQCSQFIQHLDDPLYTTPSPRLFKSSVGQHMRHILDHFVKLVSGLQSSTITYDRRDRHTPIETNRIACLDLIASLQNDIDHVKMNEMVRNVNVVVQITREKEENVTSTVGRELWFVVHHAIHHCAMAKVIAEDIKGGEVWIPDGFGVAPSTLKHEQNK